MEWVQKNFDKAMFPYNMDKGDFKPEHSRVIEFAKVWKENAYWLVEGQIEYILKKPFLITESNDNNVDDWNK